MDEDSPVRPDGPEDVLGDEAEGLGSSLPQFSRGLGRVAFVAGLVLAAWYGPDFYLDEKEKAYRACISVEPAEREGGPLSCLSEVEQAGWLAYLPWTSEAYAEFREKAVPKAHASRLRHVATVEPSAAERAEALAELEEVSEEFGPVRLAYSEPDISQARQFLSGVSESIEKARTRHVDWSVRELDGSLDFDRARQLAEFTADDDLREWVVDRAVERFGDEPLACARCSEVFELAVMACRAGRGEEGMRLAERYAEVDRTEHVDSRSGWDRYSTSRRAAVRKDARERNDEAGREVSRLRPLCASGDGEETSVEYDGREFDPFAWWETEAGRAFVGEHAAVADPVVRLAAAAHTLEREEVGPEKLEALLREMTGVAPTLERDRLFEKVATRYLSHVDMRGDLRRFWSPPPVARPEVFEAAASEIAEGFEVSADAGAASLARAMRLAAVETTLKTGAPETALEKLERIEVSERRPRWQFRAAVHQLSGRPADAAELLDEAIAARSGEPNLRNKLRLRRVTALAAAGELEAARRVYGEVSTDHWERIGLHNSRSRYAGLGYLLAFLDDRPIDDAIRQHVPAELQPDALDEFPVEHRADMLRYAHRLHTSPASERKRLRVDPRDTATDTVWYQAALGTSVEGAYDPEVFVDFVVGTGTSRFQAWRRAEAARLRGDREAAEAWTNRLFAARKRLDDGRAVLLEALF